MIPTLQPPSTKKPEASGCHDFTHFHTPHIRTTQPQTSAGINVSSTHQASCRPTVEPSVAPATARHLPKSWHNKINFQFRPKNQRRPLISHTSAPPIPPIRTTQRQTSAGANAATAVMTEPSTVDGFVAGRATHQLPTLLHSSALERNELKKKGGWSGQTHHS
jgi:hypothetical protein